jgi:hypothetical protein
MTKDVCIKAGSYCPICRGQLGGDCWHYAHEFREIRIPTHQQTAEPEWKPIETAPKDGSEVLVMYMHIETQIVHNAFYALTDWDDIDIGWWSYDKSEVSRIKLDDWMEPTHWMPLPKEKP